MSSALKELSKSVAKYVGLFTVITVWMALIAFGVKIFFGNTNPGPDPSELKYRLDAPDRPVSKTTYRLEALNEAISTIDRTINRSVSILDYWRKERVKWATSRPAGKPGSGK